MTLLPAIKVLYSKPDELLDIPSIWFAVPDVPSPVPPYESPIAEPFQVPWLIIANEAVPRTDNVERNIVAPVTPRPPWVITNPPDTPSPPD